MTYVGIIITYVFIQNLVLVDLLGLCPFTNVSKSVDTAVGLGLAMTFVMALASLLTWIVFHLVLQPLGVNFLQILIFVLGILGLVQLLEMITERTSAALYRTIGAYFPLLRVNCAVLGITLFAVAGNYNALESVFAGFAAGGGFLLVTIMMAATRERLSLEWVPKPFRGVPIAFVSAGLMAMAFLAFDKTLLKNLIG